MVDYIRAQIAQFRAWLLINRSYSRMTVDTYEPRIVAFFEWLASQGRATDPRKVKQQDVDDYIRARATGQIPTRRGNSLDRSSTLAARLAAIRAFFGYLVYAGHLHANPTAAVPTPRIPLLLPMVFTVKELRSLFSTTLPKSTDTFLQLRHKLRDRAMLMVLYGAGLRSHELVGLNVGDIQDTGKLMRITVLGKGVLQRTVPLKGVPARTLRQWLVERAALKPESADVFIRVKGTPVGMTRQNVFLRLQHYAAQVGAEDIHVFAHKFRSTWATTLNEEGKSLPVICALAGWRRPETAMRYIATSRLEQERSTLSHHHWRRILRKEAGDEEE